LWALDRDTVWHETQTSLFKTGHTWPIEDVYVAGGANVYAWTADAQILVATHSPVIFGLAKPKQVLCFAKDTEGATDIATGRDHPVLQEWTGDPRRSGPGGVFRPRNAWMSPVRQVRDLVVLAADRNIEFALRGIGSRPQSLGVHPIQADFFTLPQPDPGCYNHAATLLRSLRSMYAHALVVFDREGCGHGQQMRIDLEGKNETGNSNEC
jgi:hypothetical protein